MAYDCFGAGQQVVKLLGKLPDWKNIPHQDAEMIFNSYLAALQIHQVLWYLTEASVVRLEKNVKEEINLLLAEGKRMAGQPLEVLQNQDVSPYRERSNKILKSICNMINARMRSGGKEVTVKDYIGKDLKKKNLAGRDFCMAYLIAASLEQADLTGACFLGADMRDVNIRNTDLSQCLFLTQMQINTAKGNDATVLPPYLHKPGTWE